MYLVYLVEMECVFKAFEFLVTFMYFLALVLCAFPCMLSSVECKCIVCLESYA